ncbi:unnamed protein product [Dibothriocephalus latus]|uniref:Ig-like domain-containing protein n=1 Tax=Dibothriocephalus latus TaxID=60516 RepID=A0A3P6U1B4_DIBLA|nr:unnamed protein product [Dibothriocephalus latus]
MITAAPSRISFACRVPCESDLPQSGGLPSASGVRACAAVIGLSCRPRPVIVLALIRLSGFTLRGGADELAELMIAISGCVRIHGPKLAFYGLPLELRCIANFTSPEAKMDPSNVLEWYHNGVRIRNGRHHMGRALITRRWIDSYLLESRLLLTWVSEREGGMWFCVHRGRQTQPSEEIKECNNSQTTDMLTTAPPVNSSTRKGFAATRLETGPAETPHDELFIRIMGMTAFCET